MVWPSTNIVKWKVSTNMDFTVVTNCQTITNTWSKGVRTLPTFHNSLSLNEVSPICLCMQHETHANLYSTLLYHLPHSGSTSSWTSAKTAYVTNKIKWKQIISEAHRNLWSATSSLLISIWLSTINEPTPPNIFAHHITTAPSEACLKTYLFLVAFPQL